MHESLNDVEITARLAALLAASPGGPAMPNFPAQLQPLVAQAIAQLNDGKGEVAIDLGPPGPAAPGQEPVAWPTVFLRRDGELWSVEGPSTPVDPRAQSPWPLIELPANPGGSRDRRTYAWPAALMATAVALALWLWLRQ